MTAQRRRKPERPVDEELPAMRRELEIALKAWDVELKEMSPRDYVCLMTSSSFELGRRIKRELRDLLFEQRRAKNKKPSKSRRG
jgi:hypothetical protein